MFPFYFAFLFYSLLIYHHMFNMKRVFLRCWREGSEDALWCNKRQENRETF